MDLTTGKKGNKGGKKNEGQNMRYFYVGTHRLIVTFLILSISVLYILSLRFALVIFYADFFFLFHYEILYLFILYHDLPSKNRQLADDFVSYVRLL